MYLCVLVVGFKDGLHALDRRGSGTICAHITAITASVSTVASILAAFVIGARRRSAPGRSGDSGWLLLRGRCGRAVARRRNPALRSNTSLTVTGGLQTATGTAAGVAAGVCCGATVVDHHMRHLVPCCRRRVCTTALW